MQWQTATPCVQVNVKVKQDGRWVSPFQLESGIKTHRFVQRRLHFPRENDIVSFSFVHRRNNDEDLDAIDRMIAEGEAQYNKWRHPDPYIVPWAPGGSKFSRNPTPPSGIEIVYDYGREDND